MFRACAPINGNALKHGERARVTWDENSGIAALRGLSLANHNETCVTSRRTIPARL
jgi:hypothetical protein